MRRETPEGKVVEGKKVKKWSELVSGKSKW
jgi:hypothetical protein